MKAKKKPYLKTHLSNAIESIRLWNWQTISMWVVSIILLTIVAVTAVALYDVYTNTPGQAKPSIRGFRAKK
jgi:anti-sigma-K factor RskA